MLVAGIWSADALKACARTAGMLVIAICCVVLVGWALDIGILKSVVPGFVTMKVNTAVAFLFAGAALRAAARDNRAAEMRILAAAVAVIGVLSLCEYAFGWDLRLDQMLFRDREDPQAGPYIPGRMAPASGVLFLMTSGALLLLDSGLGSWPSQFLSIIVLGGSLFPLVGYLYGIGSMYKTGPYSSVALQTAVCFALTGAGLMLSRPDRGLMRVLASDTTGGVLGRRLLPAAFFVPLALGWILLEGQKAGFYDSGLRLVLFALWNVVILTVVIVWTAKSLFDVDNLRKAAEAKIRLLNDDLEKRVHERTTQLESANKELEAFSYSVSHDLRAPLRAIDGFSRIVMDDYAASLPEDGQSLLHDVCANTRRMGELIDDLLSFSKLGRQPLKRGRVAVDRLVKECLADLNPNHNGRRIELCIGELADCEGDVSLLRQVWINLLSNAIKYTGKCAQAVIEVGCRHGKPPDGPVYFVKDNGVGFDMRYAERLFGVFQRLHRSEDYEGTGVGLAIVARVVGRHGGRIWAESEPGKGTTFSFTVASTPPERQPETADSDRPPLSGHAAVAKPA